MTRDQLADRTVTTDEEFRTLLATLVDIAIDGGVDVRGAWEFGTPGATYNWEILISELATDLDDDYTDRRKP